MTDAVQGELIVAKPEMSRNLRVKRLWSMGQFNNIELYDEINDIPQNVALNPRAIELLYNMMIIEQELAHKGYLEVFKEHPLLLKIFPESIEYLNEIIPPLREEKKRTFEELMKELNKEFEGQKPKINKDIKE